jgi:phospholipase C
LVERDDLTILQSKHLWSQQIGIMVLTSRPTLDPTIRQFQAFEIEDVDPVGHQQLLRLLEQTRGGTVGQVTVWLWRQGVFYPVETFYGVRKPIKKPAGEEP